MAASNGLRVSRAAVEIETSFETNLTFKIAPISLAASGVGCTRLLDRTII
jgi:hypothetical protein